MLQSSKRMMAVALLAFVGAACGDDPSGPGTGTDVTLRFAAVAGPAGAPAGGPSLASPASLTITGTNGTLVIEEIRMIVAEFELDRDDDALECEGNDDACESFEAPPAFIDLPLDGGAVTVATTDVPDGTYHELEFEVEDIDFDEEDEDSAQIAAVANAVRAAFPEWPEEASMVVRGSFTPTGGTARAFTAFFDAEIEVELDLVPPLTITNGQSDRVLTVQLMPEVWFRNADGTVVDISQWDFATHGEAADFELDIESTFENGLEVDLDGFDD